MKYCLRLCVVLLLFGNTWACSTDDVDSPAETQETPLPSESRDSGQDVRPQESGRASSQRPQDNTVVVPPERTPTRREPGPSSEERASVDSSRASSGETASRPDSAAPRDVQVYTVPAGTPLTVVMSSEVSTASSKEGDTFEASLAEPWSADGRVVADRGDTVVGRVVEIIQPGKVKGRAQLKLELTQIFPGARGYKISTEPFVAIAIDNKERDAAIIAGGAGVGAAIGAITGGKKGAAIGAIVGGGGGTAAVLATRGQDMRIEPETKVNFVLDDPVRLPVIRDRSGS